MARDEAADTRQVQSRQRPIRWASCLAAVIALAIGASMVPGAIAPAAAVTSYTVTFDANGGSGSMTPQTDSSPTRLTTNAFTRTNYLFVGWNTVANGTGTEYAYYDDYPFTTSTTLYAQWSPTANVVVLNDAGGVTSSDGLRIKIGAGWRNIVRNNKQQVYVSGTNWPAGGSSAWNALNDDNPYNGVVLRVGNTSICYLEVSFPVTYPGCYLGDSVGSESPTTTSAYWDSAVTTLTSSSNPYQAVTVLEKTLSGVMYRITMTTDYTSPNSYADVTYALTIPSGTNTANVRLYDGIDMFLDGQDRGPVTAFTSGGGLNTYVQYNDTAVGGFREISGHPFGSWTGAEYYCLFGGSGDGYGCPDGRGTLASDPGGNYGPYDGTDYPNTLSSDPALDAGVAIAWDLGVVTTASPATKRSTLYFTAKTLGPGSIAVSPAFGPIAGGTSVTITGTGTNFVAGASGVLGSTVTVGGKACTPVVFISATSLTCTTTARAAAAVDVIVTNPDTTYVSGTGLFTYGTAQTVTFDANGGTGSMSAQSAVAATALTSNTFTRTGYAFSGWNTVAGGGGTAYANGASYPFTSSETLYAQWTAGSTVTFDANGGTGSLSAQTASTATALTSNTFTRTGYTFSGWNTAANGTGTAYANGASYPFTSGATLYAQWTASGGGSSGGSSGGGSSSDPSPSPSASASAASKAPENLDPIPNQVNPNIPAGGVPEGRSVYLVNGIPTTVTVRPDAQQNPTGLEVQAPDFFMKLAGYGDDQDPLGLTPQQRALILQSQQQQQQQTRFGVSPRSGVAATCMMRQPTAVSSGNGFQPNTPVKFYLLPSTYIGQLTTDATGSYKGTLPIPVGVTPGSQTLQVNGFNSSGGVRSLSLGIMVKAARTVTVKSAKSTLYFDPLSPDINAEGKAALRGLVKKAKKHGVRTVVVGFVQQTNTTANDQTLSTQRAKNVTAYLRSKGLTGAYVVRGDGIAGTGDKARRVNVTVTYQSGC